MHLKTEKIKSQKGSIAVYVTVVLFSMLIILSAIFLTSNSAIKSQIATAIKVKESYQADNSKAADIYESLVDKTDSEDEYVSEGMILHYDAINNTGNGHSSTTTTWKDLSGNGNDATVTGGRWVNNSLEFTTSNTTNGVKTNSNFSINYNNTFNIVFKYTGGNGIDPLFGARQISTGNEGFMIWNWSDSNNYLGLDTKGSFTRRRLKDGKLETGKYYDLTVTFSENTAKLYLNGTLENTITFTTGTVNSFPLTIFSAGGTKNSLGNIYSVKIYNRALSDNEVLQNYNIDKTKYDIYVSEGMILHYDAINNTGNGHSSTTTTWKDLSGNGNDATVTGGRWINNSLEFTTSNTTNGVKTNSNFSINYNNTFNIVFKYTGGNGIDPLFGARQISTGNEGFMIWNWSDSNNYLGLDTKGSFTRRRLKDGKLETGKYYDLTVTFSENTAKLYLNGTLENTITFTTGTVNSFPLTIFSAGGTKNSLGNIYSVKIYNRALSDNEVLQNYNIDKTKYDI